MCEKLLGPHVNCLALNLFDTTTHLLDKKNEKREKRVKLGTITFYGAFTSVCVKLYHLKFFLIRQFNREKECFLGDEFFMLNSWRPCIRPSACRDRSKV